MKKIVSDTGALISLEKLVDGYQFIQKLYNEIIIPPKVLEELSFHYPNPEAYLKKYNVEHLIKVDSNFIAIDAETKAIHQGEIEAISLAKTLNLELLIEDVDGRKIAIKEGLQTSGITGQILRALNKGIIDKPEALNKLEELFENKRLNKKLYKILNKKL